MFLRHNFRGLSNINSLKVDDTELRVLRQLILEFILRLHITQICLFNLYSQIQTIKLQKPFLKFLLNTSPHQLFQKHMQPNSARKQLRIQTKESIDKTFKEYAKTISDSIQKLNSFTDNLQGKVNTLLKVQQSEFVASYKNHMSNIKTELFQMNQKLKEYQNRIDFYQSQGRLSLYIKKVNYMELEQTKLFEQLTAKNKKIKELQFEIQMLKRLQKDTDEKIKIMYRKRIQDQELIQIQTQQSCILKKQNTNTNLELNPIKKHLASIETFATEIPSYHYIRKSNLNKSHSKDRQMTKFITDEGQKQRQLLYKSHQQNRIIAQGQGSLIKQNDLKTFRINDLQKQVHHLKTQNKKLLLYNSKYASNLSQLGEFFLKSVEQLKKSISVKRKVKSGATLQDFSKEDKLVLIATFLSNESAVRLLYDHIFKPRPNKDRAQSVLQKSYGSNLPDQIKSHRKIQEIMTNPQNSSPLAIKFGFPSIKSKRLIY